MKFLLRLSLAALLVSSALAAGPGTAAPGAPVAPAAPIVPAAPAAPIAPVAPIAPASVEAATRNLIQDFLNDAQMQAIAHTQFTKSLPTFSDNWKSDCQALSAEEMEASIRSAVAPFFNTAAGTRLNKIQLDDPKINNIQQKQVMKAVVVSTGQEIPNKDIASIHTLKEIFTTLQQIKQGAEVATENPKGYVVAERFQKNQSTLPLPQHSLYPYTKSKGVKAEDHKRTNKRFL
ncbi:hypothetical protein BGX29_000226 [Mortierella sp. GBA35]|nr:hypothetical protein BGX29_000226 [Mortierella sp. GBA35]